MGNSFGREKQSSSNKLPLIVFLCLLFVKGSLQQAAADDLRKAKELSLRGMKMVEMWDGRSDSLREIEQLFIQALQINPESVEALTGLGGVIMRRAYIVGDRFDIDILKISLHYANKALEIDNRYRKAHYLKGAILSVLGDHDGALKETDMLESLDKSLCDYMGLRGVVYRRQGRIQDAINEHMNELSCPTTDTPRKIKIYNSLGDFYMDIQDYTNAIKYYKESIKLMPNAAHTYGNLSRALMYRGDLDEAEEMAFKAISIYDYPMVHVYLTNIYYKNAQKYFQQDKYKEAEIEYLKSIKEDPEFKPSYFGLIDIYSKNGECDKVIDISNKILEFSPGDLRAAKVKLQCTGKTE